MKTWIVKSCTTEWKLSDLLNQIEKEGYTLYKLVNRGIEYTVVAYKWKDEAQPVMKEER